MTIETIDISLMRMFSDGPRRILERIAHRIAHDRSLVAVGALAAEVSLLDHLLGVVPRTARVGHEDRQHEARAQSADQQAITPATPKISPTATER